MVCKVLPLHCAFGKISRQGREAFSGTEIPDMCKLASGEVAQEAPINGMQGKGKSNSNKK